MRRTVRITFGGLLILVLCGTGAMAQGGSAAINGRVSDATGALLPGVGITVTQTTTGRIRNVLSNDTGIYTVPNLPTGPYRLEAALPGFRTYVRSGIVLEVNSNPTINITLEVGEVAQTVEVVANTALVETQTVGVGQIMERERILELPLNGRNASELILLSGGAVLTGVSSSRSVPGQLQISVAGPPSSAVAYSLDGAFHNNPYDNLSLPLPFPDSLQEFKVETSALSAQTGRHSGAQVNAVTKSGTNEFHGDLFEFLRNDTFNARDYGSTEKGDLKRHQFGGTLGGPIIGNKLFFFGGVQFTLNKRDPENIERFVPTQAMLNGDFRAFAACPEHNDINYPGFVNNVWTGGPFNPVSLELVKRLPKPQDECGRVVYGVPNDESDGQFVGKIDWQLNDTHSFIGRYMNTYNSKPVPHDLEPDNLLNVNNPGRDNMTQSFTLGDTWLVSPTTVAQLRLAWNRSAIARVGAKMFNMADLGVRNFVSLQPEYAQVNVAGGFNLGGGTVNDSTFRTTTYAISEDLSLSRGSHQITFGGSVAHWQSNGSANFRSSGVFDFSDDFTGNGITDFLVGRLTQFAQAGPNRGYLRKNYIGLHAADAWRATPNLTLNFGLRWEPKLPENLTENIVQNYSEERRASGFQSSVFTRAPNGFSYPGDSVFKGQSGQSKEWLLLAPRFGFAWDVFGDGRMSLRGSGGISYDLPNSQLHLWTSISPPWGGDVVLRDVPFENPFVNTPGGNPFPLNFKDPNTPFVRHGAFLTIPEKLDSPQNQTWNLALQRQIGNDWLVSATYMGSHTIHMLTIRAQNPAIYFPGRADANGNCFAQGFTLRTSPNALCSSGSSLSTDARRRLSLIDFAETGQWVSRINTYESSETSSYHGLLVNVRKRTSAGLTFNGNYTWSHCISGFNDNLAVGSTFVSYPFLDDRSRSRGNCSSDRRHNMNLTGVYATPTFQNAALRTLASNWQLANIYRWSSGGWTTIEASTDRALIGTATGDQPAQQILADPYLDRSGAIGSRWFNPAAFANPAVGTFGNAGFRNVEGPGSWQWDVALSRIFQVGEAQRIEFRAEAYNVSNSVRIDSVPGSTTITSGTFGLVRTQDVEDMRILQFALKYHF